MEKSVIFVYNLLDRGSSRLRPYYNNYNSSLKIYLDIWNKYCIFVNGINFIYKPSLHINDVILGLLIKVA